MYNSNVEIFKKLWIIFWILNSFSKNLFWYFNISIFCISTTSNYLHTEWFEVERLCSTSMHTYYIIPFTCMGKWKWLVYKCTTLGMQLMDQNIKIIPPIWWCDPDTCEPEWDRVKYFITYITSVLMWFTFFKKYEKTMSEIYLKWSNICCEIGWIFLNDFYIVSMTFTQNHTL